jgi:DNA ligase (NAD+)
MKLPVDLQKKLDRLDELDAAYHSGTGNALISDTAYDLFKDSVYRMLPPDHPRLDKVGHEVCSAWPKEKHEILMGSQNKKSTEDEIRDWVKGVLEALQVTEVKFVIQHKIDGFSLEALYDSGKLDRALTRGNGLVGDVITPNAKMFRQLPSVIPVLKNVNVRGEGVIAKSDFSIIQDKSDDRYKNSRNAASGISRGFEGKYCKHIRLIAYDINATVKTETEKIEVLNKLGFVPVWTQACSDIDEILDIYRDFRDNLRDTLPYDIDGLVLKIDDLDLQEQLGYKNNRPMGQVALKFESDQALTFIKAILLQVGRTGKITPVAVLEPVELMGSTIRKASLHNFDLISEKGIGVGAEVCIEKKGDIIPQVVDVVNAGADYIKPTVCPSCGGPVGDDGVNMWCRNKVCRERDVNRIVYWIQVIDMKGFSESFVEKLWDMEKLRTVADLYRLKVDDFIAIEGVGESTIKSFFERLQSTSTMYLEKFITALGIPSCSKSTAEDLVEKFGSWDKITAMHPAELQRLPGYAETSARTICSGIQEVADMATELLNVITIKYKKTGPFTGLSFCVTGSLASMGRKEFEDLVVDKGGIAKKSVAEGLTYLVTNDKDSGSKKNEKALKYGVKIINEEEFLNILGERPEINKPESVVVAKSSEILIESENIF